MRWFAALLVVAVLVACGGGSKSHHPAPPPYDGWAIRFGSGMPAYPTHTSPDEWYFDFPALGDGSVNYITKPYTAPLTGGTIVMVLKVTTTGPAGAPKFEYGYGEKNSCLTPATVRPYFETKDDLTNEFGRWWAHLADYTLADGQMTLTVPLHPSQWLSVFGKHADMDQTTLNAFNKALENVAQVGMTFGGGCFFGHGVSVSGGTARFTLLKYEVTHGPNS